MRAVLALLLLFSISCSGTYPADEYGWASTCAGYDRKGPYPACSPGYYMSCYVPVGSEICECRCEDM